jgi:hypothetical protein
VQELRIFCLKILRFVVIIIIYKESTVGPDAK